MTHTPAVGSVEQSARKRLEKPAEWTKEGTLPAVNQFRADLKNDCPDLVKDYFVRNLWVDEHGVWVEFVSARDTFELALMTLAGEPPIQVVVQRCFNCDKYHFAVGTMETPAIAVAHASYDEMANAFKLAVTSVKAGIEADKKNLSETEKRAYVEGAVKAVMPDVSVAPHKDGFSFADSPETAALAAAMRERQNAKVH